MIRCYYFESSTYVWWHKFDATIEWSNTTIRWSNSTIQWSNTKVSWSNTTIEWSNTTIVVLNAQFAGTISARICENNSPNRELAFKIVALKPRNLVNHQFSFDHGFGYLSSAARFRTQPKTRSPTARISVFPTYIYIYDPGRVPPPRWVYFATTRVVPRQIGLSCDNFRPTGK